MISQERLASPQERLADTVRDEGRRVLATLIRTLGDLQLAEDAVQEAAVAALRAWPAAGVPDDPRAWLTVTARNKAYDMLRHEAARPVKETAAAWPAPQESADPAQEVLDMVEPESVVHDGKHGRQPLRQLGVGRHPVGDPGVGDLLPCSY